MTQHEIYTFPPGMRVYDENGVAQDPLASGGGSGGGALVDFVPQDPPPADPDNGAVLYLGADYSLHYKMPFNQRTFRLVIEGAGPDDHPVSVELYANGSNVPVRIASMNCWFRIVGSDPANPYVEMSAGGTTIQAFTDGHVEFAGGDIRITGALPEADPHVVGQLWRNGGALAVSAG